MSGPRAAPTEKQVQQEVKNLAHLCGFDVADFSQPRASMQTPGIPDLLLHHRKRGFVVWVEVKRPGGKLSPHQKAWKQMVEEAGVEDYHSIVCSSADDLDSWMRSEGYL